MSPEEAKGMIEKVRLSYGTDNFTRGSYNAIHWFECVKNALEKQIKKKPSRYPLAYGTTGCNCPNCGRYIWSYDGISGMNFPNNCHHCGQAIDWGR